MLQVRLTCLQVSLYDLWGDSFTKRDSASGELVEQVVRVEKQTNCYGN